eukprot:3987499-Karenia_brevis.AAC.1
MSGSESCESVSASAQSLTKMLLQNTKQLSPRIEPLPGAKFSLQNGSKNTTEKTITNVKNKSSQRC